MPEAQRDRELQRLKEEKARNLKSMLDENNRRNNFKMWYTAYENVKFQAEKETEDFCLQTWKFQVKYKADFFFHIFKKKWVENCELLYFSEKPKSWKRNT